MIDRKKLLAFLRLQRAPDYPAIKPAVSDDDLAAEMDRYDLTKQPPTVRYDYAVNPNPTATWITPQAQPVQYLTYGQMAQAYGQISLSSPSSCFQLQGFSPSDVDLQSAENAIEAKRQKRRTFVEQLDRLSGTTPEKIAAPPKRSPDFISCLTGWRAWAVSKGKLESLGTVAWWKPKQAQRAYCNQSNDHEDGCPSETCQCGWWSFKSMGLMARAVESYLDSIAVIGPVDVWGKVIECENGYRSEFAYPKELWLLKDGLEFLSWVYAVPVRKM